MAFFVASKKSFRPPRYVPSPDLYCDFSHVEIHHLPRGGGNLDSSWKSFMDSMGFFDSTWVPGNSFATKFSRLFWWNSFKEHIDCKKELFWKKISYLVFSLVAPDRHPWLVNYVSNYTVNLAVIHLKKGEKTDFLNRKPPRSL